MATTLFRFEHFLPGVSVAVFWVCCQKCTVCPSPHLREVSPTIKPPALLCHRWPSTGAGFLGPVSCLSGGRGGKTRGKAAQRRGQWERIVSEQRPPVPDSFSALGPHQLIFINSASLPSTRVFTSISWMDERVLFSGSLLFLSRKTQTCLSYFIGWHWVSTLSLHPRTHTTSYQVILQPLVTSQWEVIFLEAWVTALHPEENIRHTWNITWSDSRCPLTITVSDNWPDIRNKLKHTTNAIERHRWGTADDLIAFVFSLRRCTAAL